MVLSEFYTANKQKVNKKTVLLMAAKPKYKDLDKDPPIISNDYVKNIKPSSKIRVFEFVTNTTERNDSQARKVISEMSQHSNVEFFLAKIQTSIS